MNKFAIVLCCLLLFLNSTVGVAGSASTVPAPASSALLQRLEHAHWVASGSTSPARVVYVFTDPNCPYCNDLWKALQTARPADVQIRYLLVAVIDDESRGKDASILESKDPAASLEQHERAFDKGGIAVKQTVQPATKAVIFANEQLMSALKIFGTPGLVRLGTGNELMVFAGMPNPGQLAKLLGPR